MSRGSASGDEDANYDLQQYRDATRAERTQGRKFTEEE